MSHLQQQVRGTTQFLPVPNFILSLKNNFLQLTEQGIVARGGRCVF